MEFFGLLNICKLPGLSSHEVVARIRRLLGMKRVGHTGTLDPSAAGVLPICLGTATRLAEYIAAGPKTYRAEFLLGVTTLSYDSEAEISEQRDAGHLTEAEVTAVLPTLTGSILQRPPDYSAVFVEGVRAYDLVRRGKAVDLPAREVTVYAFTPVRFVPGTTPRLLADITVSKGTYIRALARDLGELLGVGALLSFLVRTQVGDCLLENSYTLDEIASAVEEERLEDCLRAPDSAINYIPALSIPTTAVRYRYGAMLDVTEMPGLYRIYQGRLFMGLGRVEEGRLRPAVNLLEVPGHGETVEI